MKASIVKIVGMVGSLITGGVLCWTGNTIEGIGIISASLSSAYLTKPKSA